MLFGTVHWVAPLVLYALASAPAPSDYDEIHLRERRPLLMLVLTPGDQNTSPRASALFRAADEVLRDRTGLSIETPEQAGIDLTQIALCKASELLACYSRTVARESPASRRHHLLVLTLFEREGGATTVSALLIDLDSTASARAELSGAELEDAIFERTVRSREETLTLDDQAAVSAYFRRLVDEQMRSAFEQAGDYEPFGELELSGAPPGLEIEIDGNLVGRTAAHPTRVTEIRSRSVTINIQDASKRWLPFTTTANVVRGERTQVALALIRAAEPGPGPLLQRATFWSGLGLAAAGAVVSVYAIAASPGGSLNEACTEANCAEKRATFAPLCALGKDRADDCGGVLAAPLGYSLLLTGGAWAVGTELLTGEDEVPWLPLTIGAALGIIAYGVSAAAN